MSQYDGCDFMCLPLELEREIFETAATRFPSCARSLVLVAHRVKKWIEPMLYSVLVHRCSESINYPPLYRKSVYGTEEKSPWFYKLTTSARHVLLQGVGLLEAEDILERCSKVHDLALWQLSTLDFNPFLSLISIFESLSLRRLSVNIMNLSAQTVFDLKFDDTPFTNLTHLQVISPDVPFNWDWKNWENLALLPSLTHLAFNNWSFDFVRRILAKCKHLEALVLFPDWVSSYQGNFIHRNRLCVVDDRIVNLSKPNSPVLDWINGTNADEDFWKKAERLIAKQSNLSFLVEVEDNHSTR